MRVFVKLSPFYIIVALAGCYQEGQVVLHEPGVYKGPSDPLVGNTDTAALNERFSNQMDR